MSQNLNGKVALITGGATGLGRATGAALARLGCSVAVNHIQPMKENANQAVAELAALGIRAIAVEADVTDSDACRAMVATVVREFGRLDVLVNCAGVTRFIPHADMDAVSDEDWDFILGVNVKGTFHCCRAARAALEAGGGAIVNVASIAGFNGAGSSIPYAVSKAGIINLTMALARVFAPKVRVNAVAPGFIDGDWMRKGLGERYAASKESFSEVCLLGRISQPEDVADAIVSLIAGSQMVTGQTLVCDGGALLADPASRGVRSRE
jgi:3-oxoacyl-[acyl-carrier protein] reductase